MVVSKEAGINASEETCLGREWGIGCASVSGSWTSLSKMRESSARLFMLEREIEEARENWSLSSEDFLSLLVVDLETGMPFCLMK